MRSSTSPWPGSGTGTSRNSTVLLPGRNAPVMLGFTPFAVPEIFPGLVLLPQKDLAFDQAAVAIDGRDLAHLVIGERIAHRAFEIGS